MTYGNERTKSFFAHALKSGELKRAA